METPAAGIRESHQRRATALGLFSVALGLSELTVPDRVAGLIGVRDRQQTRWVLRALGIREILTGLGILARRDAAGPLWARVAGDALDLGLLGSSFRVKGASKGRLIASTAAVAGVTLVDAYAAAGSSRNSTAQKLVQPIHVVRSITINRDPAVVYQFWRQLENLPKFMAHLESVQNQGDSWLWRTKGPAGSSIEWRAEITLDIANEKLAWRSLDGATVPNRGVVCFQTPPNGRGTEIIVELKYEPPGGALGAAVAKLFGEEPGQQISGDLRRLKQVLETGTVTLSDASIHKGPHPARPPASDERVTLLGSEV